MILSVVVIVLYMKPGGMKHLVVVVLTTVTLTSSSPIPSGVTIGLRPEYFHPIQTLYHSQDKLGQYSYGYATPAISRSEIKGSDGVTRGGYSYIDEHGRLQTVHYTADPVHGFRVAASNLPVEDPDVAHARAAHLAEFAAVQAERAQIAANIVAAHTVPYSNPVAVPARAVPAVPANQQVLPRPVEDLPEVAAARAAHLAALRAAYAGHALAQAPTPVADVPEVALARAAHLAAVEETRARDAALRAQIAVGAVPQHLEGHVVPVVTQGSAVAAPAEAYRADGWAVVAPYSYGYLGPHSAAAETKSADGVVRGGYSFIDANGIVQTVHYIADAGGFRVAASNLPVDRNHLVAPVQHGVQAAASAQAVAEERKVVVPALYSTEVVY